MPMQPDIPQFNENLPDYKSCPKLLVGQKALVTGANSAIGRAVAIGLARRRRRRRQLCEQRAGSRGGRRGDRGRGCERPRYRGRRVQGSRGPGDVPKALAAFGTIDILVPNAGLQRDASLVEMSLEQWNMVIGINLTGQFRCIREAVREFLRRGVNKDVSVAVGKIICMSSVHEVIRWSGHVNCASSKGGIQMMMKSLAQELAPHRVRVDAIGPGAIRTPINNDAWSTPEAYAELMKLVPYRRIGEPDDIAQAAVFPASDMADYINGVTLFVDGGVTCYPGFATGG